MLDKTALIGGRKLTFGRQLLLSFGALIAMMLVAAVVSLGRLSDVDHARQHIGRAHGSFATSVATAAVDMKAMANDERGYLMKRRREVPRRDHRACRQDPRRAGARAQGRAVAR